MRKSKPVAVTELFLSTCKQYRLIRSVATDKSVVFQNWQKEAQPHGNWRWVNISLLPPHILEEYHASKK